MARNDKFQKIEPIVSECLSENNIDIGMFCECKNTDVDAMIDSTTYRKIDSPNLDCKVTIIAKKDISVEIIRSQNRFLIMKVDTFLKQYLITAAHLQDTRNYSHSDRMNTIKEIIVSLEEEEKRWFLNGPHQKNNTMIIGDFNSEFYDEELLSIYGFNSVMFEELLDQKETRTFNDVTHELFYNPIPKYIFNQTDCNDTVYGSYYSKNRDYTPFWHCLDQIVIRKPLIKALLKTRYLKRIKSTEFITSSNLIDKSISDHLPLFAEFEET